MKIVAICFALTCGLVAPQGFAQSNDENSLSRAELNRGVEAYKSGHYAEAVQHFEQALKLDPENQNAELYLGTAYLIQWVPGADSAANAQNYDLAQRHFKAVLAKDARNELALAMLASMAYNSAMARNGEEKTAALQEAKRWNERRIEVNPRGGEPYYYIGVIDWATSFTPVSRARTEAKMKPSDRRPLDDSAVRKQLHAQYADIVQEGLSNLEKCLAIDHENEDAMSYVNLLLRVKATLEDDAGAAQTDYAQADVWATKAIETKKKKAAGVQQ